MSKIVYMTHPDHGVMPVYQNWQIKQNRAEGWKECPAPKDGVSAMEKVNTLKPQARKEE